MKKKLILIKSKKNIKTWLIFNNPSMMSISINKSMHNMNKQNNNNNNQEVIIRKLKLMKKMITRTLSKQKREFKNWNKN